MDNTSTYSIADSLADVQAVADHIAFGKPISAEQVRRIREESRKIQEEIRRKHGVLDIGVPAIRELRGELPEQ